MAIMNGKIPFQKKEFPKNYFKKYHYKCLRNIIYLILVNILAVSISVSCANDGEDGMAFFSFVLINAMFFWVWYNAYKAWELASIYREETLRRCDCKTEAEFIWKWNNHMINEPTPHVPSWKDSPVYTTYGMETLFTIWLIMLLPAILAGGFAGFMVVTVICALPLLILLAKGGQYETWVDDYWYGIDYCAHVGTLAKFRLDVKKGKRKAIDFKLIEDCYPSEAEELKLWDGAALELIKFCERKNDWKLIDMYESYLITREKNLIEEKEKREKEETERLIEAAKERHLKKIQEYLKQRGEN